MRDPATDSARRGRGVAPGGSGDGIWCHDGAGAEAQHRDAIDIPPDPRSLAEVRRFTERAMTGTGLDDRSCYEMTVAVHEAVVNAMQHGSDADQPVRVTACRDPRGVSFTIADRGEHFVLEPSTEPDLEARGRGLTLMFHAVDDISQHPRPDGKEIRMTKWLLRD